MPIHVRVDPEIEKRFRELAMKKYGYSKGALRKAIEEAMLMWIEKNRGTSG